MTWGRQSPERQCPIETFDSHQMREGQSSFSRNEIGVSTNAHNHEGRKNSVDFAAGRRRGRWQTEVDLLMTFNSTC